MATDLENLTARRSAILTELAALTTTKAGGLPNSQASGVDHVGYKDSLYRELREINEVLAAIEGPFELHTEGIAE